VKWKAGSSSSPAVTPIVVGSGVGSGWAAIGIGVEVEDEIAKVGVVVVWWKVDVRCCAVQGEALVTPKGEERGLCGQAQM
jgi:hypothetical protein